MAGVFVMCQALIFARYMRIVTICLIAVALFTSCEKDISVNLQQQVDKLVVEGKIENGRHPQIVLTRSLDYFSKIDPIQLLNSFVHHAIVTVSNGDQVITLKEYTRYTTDGVAQFFYSVDSAQLASAFKGELNTTYTLKIVADNKSYEAVTTIPDIKLLLDDMYWQKAISKNDSTKARLIVRIIDPPDLGNYARYFTKRNSEPYYPGLTSVINDELTNGTTFDIGVDPGVNRNQKIDYETNGYFTRGDTVTMKFCNIDKATYDFWRTLDFAFSSTGNPFSSPTQILSNVKDALGYWGGYAVQYKTIIIPK
jgi:hypothetical protein